MAKKTETKQARSLRYADVGEKAKISLADVTIWGILTNIEFKCDYNGTKTISAHIKVESGYSILKLAPESLLDIQREAPNEDPKEELSAQSDQ